ncbi:MAG: prephenate dehydratase [Candidatus Omnitrophota bacterium]
MSLQNLRRRIDGIDKKIVSLLDARTNISLNIGRIKAKEGTSVYSSDRERQVLDRVKQVNKGPISNCALEAIYREIMSASLAAEKSLKVAYLGPEATFANLAAIKRFGSQVEYMPCDSISDVFLSVERESADYGVVPIENSIEGAVSYTMDLLAETDLKICAQVILNISHNLLANCPKNKIKKVYSNPMVFGQCKMWLQQNLPGVEMIEVSSTTRAAQIAAKDKFSAAIASLLAARVYKIKIIAKDIEDSPHNVTRFLVIAKYDVGPTGRDKTSIIFSIKDKVGALHAMLVPFKKNRINLTKIESRPSKRKAWDYYFFVDLEGHRQDSKVKKALGELEAQCRFIKILGSYPLGE